MGFGDLRPEKRLGIHYMRRLQMARGEGSLLSQHYGLRRMGERSTQRPQTNQGTASSTITSGYDSYFLWQRVRSKVDELKVSGVRLAGAAKLASCRSVLRRKDELESIAQELRQHRKVLESAEEEVLRQRSNLEASKDR